MNKTGSNTLRLWRATGIGGIQKHTSNKLYWILFPIEDLRQAVETAKRVLTKEKLDKATDRSNFH